MQPAHLPIPEVSSRRCAWRASMEGTDVRMLMHCTVIWMRGVTEEGFTKCPSPQSPRIKQQPKLKTTADEFSRVTHQRGRRLLSSPVTTQPPCLDPNARQYQRIRVIKTVLYFSFIGMAESSQQGALTNRASQQGGRNRALRTT